MPDFLDQFRFAQPEFLGLLAIVPLLALWRARRGRLPSIRFSATALAAHAARDARARLGWLPALLRPLVLTCAILALARPQFGEGIREIKASGIDIILTVDLSTSMWAHDFELAGQPTDRLSAVKHVVEQFVEQRPSDRIGLVAFAAQPYLVSPPTLDHDWLLRQLKRLRIGMIEDGTAIGSAIGSSTNRLRDLPSKSRVVILLTDGENNRGRLTPIAAAEAAAAVQVKVYTIGAGRQGNVPFPALDRNNEPYRDRAGQMRFRYGESQVDHSSLERIAEITGARFFRATNTQALQQIYNEIDQLEKTDLQLIERTLYEEAFFWPAMAALGLLSLEQLILLRRRPLP